MKKFLLYIVPIQDAVDWAEGKKDDANLLLTALFDENCHSTSCAIYLQYLERASLREALATMFSMANNANAGFVVFRSTHPAVEKWAIKMQSQAISYDGNDETRWLLNLYSKPMVKLHYLVINSLLTKCAS